MSQASSHQLTLTGTSYASALGAETNGDYLQLTGTTDAFAYAIYRLGLGGIEAESIDVQIALLAAPSGGESVCWLGLADYASGAWAWQPWGELMASPLIPTGQYHSCGGNAYIALVTPAGSALEVRSITASIHGLGVGPARDYGTIEDAYAAASDGDTILVFPQEDNAPYLQPARSIRAASPSRACRR